MPTAPLLLLALQVTAMQGVAEAKQVVVAQAKADCEELLVQIVQDKRAADEQERQVHTGGLGLCRATLLESRCS